MYFEVLFALTLGSAWLCSGQNMEDMPKYDQRYDYLDVDGILDSRRLVRNYVDCLINVKPCTPEGKALRRILPEALRTKCARCSERQKRVAVKVIHRLKTEYPLEWSKLASRWDPTGDFSAYFEHVIAKEHFNHIGGNSNEGESGDAPTVSRKPPPSTTRRPPPAPPAAPSVTPEFVMITPPPPTTSSTSPKPLILNRFGDDEQEEGTNNNAQQPSSVRPVMVDKPVRPTAIPWDSATASPAPSNPTRFTFRPMGGAEMTPLYATTVTLIDHLGSKLMRTTELVADLLRNTVRVLGG